MYDKCDTQRDLFTSDHSVKLASDSSDCLQCAANVKSESHSTSGTTSMKVKLFKKTMDPGG